MYPVCSDLCMASAEVSQCTAGHQEGISHGQRQAAKTEITHFSHGLAETVAVKARNTK